MFDTTPRRALFVLATLLATSIVASHAATYEEAPELAVRVATGQLPAVAKRLPENPDVIIPAKNGRFGSTLRSALLADGDQNGILRFVAQGLLRWDTKFDHIEPNIAERWTRNADATEYIFTLRRGMRWSDGQPFTADDVVFAVNDVIGNREIFKTVADRYQGAGQVMTAEKIDDMSVRIRFAGGNRMFAEELAGPYTPHPVIYPKHYCAKYHAKYNPQADEQARQAGAANWVAMFHRQCGDFFTRWSNPDRPTLDPWVLTNAYTGKADAKTDTIVLKRNAYYWQVDTQGRQLPYLDSVAFKVHADPGAVVTAAAAGLLDLQIRHVSSVQARKQLAPLVSAGNYAFMSLPDVNASAVGLYLNHTTPNAPLRVLFNSLRFKSALSMAIDRKEIARQVFLNEVQPWQAGPPFGHRFYNEKLATQYTRFDGDTANRILDEIVATRRDDQGFRWLGARRLSLRAIVNNNSAIALGSLALIKQSWARIGVELIVESLDRSVNAERSRTNDYDISVDVISGGLDPTQNPRAYLAVHPADSRQALPWVRWYDSHGTQGAEPSPAMQRRLQLWDQWKAALSDAEADRLFREILAIAADELEVIGTVTAPAQAGIRNARLMNVPDSMPGAWIWPTPGPSMPQQYFFAP